MKNSILTKIIIITSVVFLIMGTALTFVSYSFASDRTYNFYSELASSATRIVSVKFDNTDLSEPYYQNVSLLKEIIQVKSISELSIYLPDEKNKAVRFFYSSDSDVLLDRVYYNHVMTEGEKQALSGHDVTKGEMIDDGNILACYSPITDKNGKVCAIVKASVEYSTIKHQTNLAILRTVLSVVAIFAAGMIIICIILKVAVFKKMRLLTNRMNSFVSKKKTHFCPVEIRSSDEVGQLADAFNKMGTDIETHVKKIMEMMLEKEQQKTSLELAQKIQKGFLPNKSFCSVGVNLFAQMKTAKNVGGDFYDYFFVGRNKICIVIADVSGKGISAALFMANAKAVLHDLAIMGRTPSRLIYKTNNQLCKNNPEQMFVTVFAGILDVITGSFTYANAGHNPPAVLIDGKIQLLNSTGIAAGLFEDEEYKEKTINLSVGDKLFLYTDGVTEAVSKNKEFYTEKRLVNALKSNIASSPTMTVNSIMQSLNDFTQDREQSDDITMLALELCKTESVVVSAVKENLNAIRALIEKQKINQSIKMKLYLAAEEIFVNICNYAFDKNEKGNVQFEISTSLNSTVMRFIDNGRQFNPLKIDKDINKYNIDSEIGGLGIFITKKISDELSYEYSNNNNILTIIFNFKGGNNNDNQ